MTQYRMTGAFDLSDAHDLSSLDDRDAAVRFTWGELVNDLRDDLPEGLSRDDIKFVSYTTSGDDVHVTFEAPVDDLHIELDYLNIERAD